MLNDAKQSVENAPTQEEEMQTTTITAAKQPLAASKWSWYLGLLAGLVAHSLFGIHPIFSRYLQHTTSNKFPPLLLIGSMNFIALVLYMPRILYKCVRQILLAAKQSQEAATFKEKLITVLRFAKQEIISQSWILIFFAINLILRSITNIMSSKYAQAIYVQLIALSVPFMVTILATCISKAHALYMRKVKKVTEFEIMFADEAINIKTLFAIAVSVIGGALIILGGVGRTEHWYDFATNFKFHNIGGAEISTSDIIGMILSLVSSITLAVYMIQLRFMKTRKSKQEFQFVNLNNGEDVFIVQLIVLSMNLIPSAFLEPWTVYFHMEVKDWVMYLLFTFLVFMLANGCNVYAIQNLGAATAGSMLPLRLVAVIVVGTIVLDEYMQSFWPLLGAITVIGGISYFMYVKHRESKAKAAKVLELQKQQEQAAIEQNPTEEHSQEQVALPEDLELQEKEEFLSNGKDTTENKPSVETPIE